MKRFRLFALVGAIVAVGFIALAATLLQRYEIDLSTEDPAALR